MDDAAALERRLASLAELLEHAQDGILVAIADSGRFRFANRRICEMLGYGRTELLERQVADIHPAAALPEVLGGVDCCRRIRALDPEARILIASGYAEDDAVRQLLAEGISGFVQKPFDLVTLSRAVSAAMGR